MIYTASALKNGAPYALLSIFIDGYISRVASRQSTTAVYLSWYKLIYHPRQRVNIEQAVRNTSPYIKTLMLVPPRADLFQVTLPPG